MDLTLKEYQNWVDNWVKTIGVRYFSELTNLAQLVEEIGEVARIMARVYGDQSFKASEKNFDLADELADVMFVIACIANQTGIDLTPALRKNIEKKTLRDRQRHIQNRKLTEESVRTCSACGEILQKDWTFCPSCEAPQAILTCPQCNRPVKVNWKRCPECQGKLIDPNRTEPKISDPSPVFIEPVTGMEFIYVPGGDFMMGDSYEEGMANELPVHPVTLDGFYIGKFSVTQGQWKTVMTDNPSKFAIRDDYPVEQVTWHDVCAFIKALIELNENRYAFRLPTEAEWEYSARSGGKQEIYAGGDTIELVAWYQENSDGSTHPVGKKAPNGLGIYDMSGNVWEWCEDTFNENAYTLPTPRNPLVIEDGTVERTLRGGSWNLDAWSARCTRRFGFPADYKGSGLGFRLVCTFPLGSSHGFQNR